MSFQDITIIITSFKSDEKIKNCLNSIKEQCRVIVVENSDNVDFKKRIESEYSNVDCILTGENLGYGKANNIGLKKTKTKYAFILNPDTILHSSTLENLLSVIKKIPDFAIIGPFVQEKKDEVYKNKNSNPLLVKNVKGFAMFLNMSEFNEIGFFDESFFIYFEEIDLCRRLINNNKKIYLAPEVVIDHFGAQSHDKKINEAMELSRNWHWMWSTFNYHKKYKGFIISLFIVFPKLLSSIFKVTIYSITLSKKKKIYYQRLSGLMNAILGKKSWYRPKV